MSRLFYPKCHAILQLIFDGFGEEGADSAPMVFPVRPKTATIHRNSYRQADSYELTFSANELPIDPQLIRAGAVEVFLYQTDDLNDPFKYTEKTVAEGVLAEQKQPACKKPGQTGFLNPQIAGLIDDVSVTYNGGDREVSITGQDYTAFLLERQWKPTAHGKPRKIPVKQRIDTFVRNILAEVDEEEKLRVCVRGLSDADLPTVGKNEVRSNKRGIPIHADTSYWDVIYSTVIRHGLIVFVDGLEVVLTRPQNFSKEYKAKPMRLAWGRNLDSLEMSRKLGKETVPQIVAQGYDPKTKKNIVATYPEKAMKRSGGAGKKYLEQKTSRKTKREKTSSTTLKNEFQIFPFYGITDIEVLRQAAENIYNILGRAERIVRIVTKDLKDSDRSDAFDMLQAKTGDPAVIEFEEFNVNHALLADIGVPDAQKYAHLTNLGYSPQVAQLLTSHYSAMQSLARPMRVREISFSFSVDDGVSIEAELVDYVVVDGTRDSANKVSKEDNKKHKWGELL